MKRNNFNIKSPEIDVQLVVVFLITKPLYTPNYINGFLKPQKIFYLSTNKLHLAFN